jgi:hypothetical protein
MTVLLKSGRSAVGTYLFSTCLSQAGQVGIRVTNPRPRRPSGNIVRSLIMSLGCKETVIVWSLDMPTLQHLLRQSQGRVAATSGPAGDHVENRSIYNTASKHRRTSPDRRPHYARPGCDRPPTSRATSPGHDSSPAAWKHDLTVQNPWGPEVSGIPGEEAAVKHVA